MSNDTHTPAHTLSDVPFKIIIKFWSNDDFKSNVKKRESESKSVGIIF
jgi:hypothetical protein